MGYVTMKRELITLRKADINDAKLLWRWRNEKMARKSAFNSEYISYDSHLKWFKNKLKDSNSFRYIALNGDGIPVGQIRFDKLCANSLEVDVSVSKEHRGKGYGTELTKSGCRKIFDEIKINKILARAKRSNVASIKAFSNSGFKKIKDTFYENHDIIEMKLVKNEN